MTSINFQNIFDIIGAIGSCISIIGAIFVSCKWIMKLAAVLRYRMGFNLTSYYLEDMRKTSKRLMESINRPNRFFAKCIWYISDICICAVIILAIISIVEDWYIRNCLLIGPLASAFYSTTVLALNLKLILDPVLFYDRGIFTIQRRLARLIPQNNTDQQFILDANATLALYKSQREALSKHYDA